MAFDRNHISTLNFTYLILTAPSFCLQASINLSDIPFHFLPQFNVNICFKMEVTKDFCWLGFFVVGGVVCLKISNVSALTS